MIAGRKIRVLIVDDSVVVRRILKDSLASEPDIEVVGTAPDPIAAMERLDELKPDVLTLDVEMPRMDGLQFLRKLMHSRPLPVIMISSITQHSSRAAIEAMAEGAVEVLAKPNGPYSVGEFRFTLGQKVRNAASARLRPRRGVRAVAPAAAVMPAMAASPVAAAAGVAGAVKLIVIGASTGGTQAIEQVLRPLPAEMPPIAIVQHIPAGFSKSFADRLNQLCALTVREAADGDVLAPGVALIAPGNFHLRVRRTGERFRVSVSDGPLVCFQRPSVDVLFDSVAEGCAAGAMGVILTGMGADGAAGMVRMRSAGVRTVAQNEESCVVFGMPREAIRIGGVDEVVPLDRIAMRLMGAATGGPAGGAGRSRAAVPAR
jgi:two-component system, chemotaxis family, protein-glutamate methylesterase/glutaminase